MNNHLQRDQLTEHLRFAKELGVTGVSRDPIWRGRGNGVESLLQIRPAGTREVQETPAPVSGVIPLTAIRADIGREEEIVRLFEAAERELGKIGGLVNNAGVTGGFTRVEALRADAIAQVLAVNVAGTMLCSREAVRRMSTRRGGMGGSIVNISSVCARTGGAGEWVHYAASKGAINTFTIGLAREVATEGIRVNAVAPGLIETPLHAANGAPDRANRMAPTIPM